MFAIPKMNSQLSLLFRTNQSTHHDHITSLKDKSGIESVLRNRITRDIPASPDKGSDFKNWQINK